MPSPSRPRSTRAADRGAPAALPRLRWRTALPLIVVLAFAVHALLPRFATLAATADVLQHLRRWALLLAVVLQAASYWGNAYALRSVARLTDDRLGMWDAVRLALASGTVGLLAGGAVGTAAATYHWTRGRGTSHEGALLCGWLPAVLNLIVLGALTIVGAIELVLRDLLPRSQRLTLGLLSIPLVALLLGGGWVVAREERLRSVVARLRRTWSRLRRRPIDADAIAEAADRVADARRRLGRGGWRRPLLGATANAGFDVLTLWSLFLAARHTIGPDTLLAGYGLPQLVGRVAFLPGGLGVIEGGMVGLYAALGVPTTTGVLVVLAYRGLSFWVPTLLGFPLAALLERATRTNETTAKAPDPA